MTRTKRMKNFKRDDFMNILNTIHFENFPMNKPFCTRC
jgi:hypothetical protein